VIGSALILWAFSGNVFIWDSTLWEFAAWAPTLGLIALMGFLVWLFLAGAFSDPAVFWGNLIDRVTNTLYTDTRRNMQSLSNSNQGYGSSAVMGVVFSAGWTPCIGPVYGAVLTMAANGGDVGQAGSLLTAYSLGLGIPFILTALALDSAQTILRKVQRHMHKIELASGAFLVLIGLLVASGQLQALSQQFAGQFAEFSITVEQAAIEALTGQDTSFSGTSAAKPETSTASDLVVVNPETGQTSPAPPAADDVEPVEQVSSITDLAANSPPSVGIAIGNRAANFETITDRGQPISLQDLRGQVVLLNFWATWCGPCRIEMPEFEAIYNEHKDAGFTILAVNNAEPLDDVQGFREEFDLSFPLAMDERADIQNLYNIFSYPSTFIVDRDGIIVARHFGPLTAEQISDLVTEALS
jgi:cytochrome c-type biogenesis protein